MLIYTKQTKNCCGDDFNCYNNKLMSQQLQLSPQIQLSPQHKCKIVTTILICWGGITETFTEEKGHFLRKNTVKPS